MKLTTKCALCNEMAEWSRNKKDRPTQCCKNEWCLLFNKEHIIDQPLPKIIKSNKYYG